MLCIVFRCNIYVILQIFCFLTIWLSFYARKTQNYKKMFEVKPSALKFWPLCAQNFTLNPELLWTRLVLSSNHLRGASPPYPQFGDPGTVKSDPLPKFAILKVEIAAVITLDIDFFVAFTKIYHRFPPNMSIFFGSEVGDVLRSGFHLRSFRPDMCKPSHPEHMGHSCVL